MDGTRDHEADFVVGSRRGNAVRELRPLLRRPGAREPDHSPSVTTKEYPGAGGTIGPSIVFGCDGMLVDETWYTSEEITADSYWGHDWSRSEPLAAFAPAQP